jgi:D-3-phosphoglycerate dehydrogenase / 2-oxoglutarate reductase
MRVLFADSNHSILHETLTAAGFDCNLAWDKSAEELMELMPAYDALVIRSRFRITKELIDRSKNLKCIGRVGAGMENIDVSYATSKNIVCVCAPEGNRDAVGEHALGMLLMLLNKLKKADGEVRKGIWLRAENRGHEIKEKTIGIIGYGNTGSAFARKLSGFECNILAYDKYKTGFSDKYVTESPMEDLFAKCDIVSLHVPLTDETRSLVNRDFLGKFQKPIYLVNTSRGPCLNTADLVDAMKAGNVTGACLDVLEYESTSFEALGKEIPPPLEFLIHSDRVILTPHIAGWTHESNYKMSRIIAEKMIDALKTKS